MEKKGEKKKVDRREEIKRREASRGVDYWPVTLDYRHLICLSQPSLISH